MANQQNIDVHDLGLILDVAHHFSLRHGSIVIKDIQVVRALSALLGADFGDARLVFAGGTCLARAHRLVRRMSEDIDLKVVIPDMNDLSKSALRKKLSRIKNSAVDALVGAGFEIDKDAVRSRNDNRNVEIRFPYGAVAEIDSVLDSKIKLELVCKAPRLPTVQRSLPTLASEALGREPEIAAIDCVSITETAAEKVVSLTRRVVALLEDARPDALFDHRLVRHVFDLHAMREVLDKEAVCKLAREIAIMDAAEFRNQNPGYAADPVGWTAKAMESIVRDPMHRRDYERFVQEMVYGTRVGFEDAVASLQDLASGLWPSGGVYVPPFPAATHMLTPANGAVRIVDRGTGKVDNPSGLAVVTLDGMEQWFRDGRPVDPFSVEPETDPSTNRQP